MAKEYFSFLGKEAIPVIERNEAVDQNSCVAVCVVTSPYVPIEQALLARGVKEVMPFYDITEYFKHKHPLGNGWFINDFQKRDQNCISFVLQGWDDATSRAHYLQFLAWRRLRQEWSFAGAPVMPQDKYFLPEITPLMHEREVFVDGGSHHANTMMRFVHTVKGKFYRIIAIEPDKANRAGYAHGVKQLTVLDCALTEHAGIAKFHDGLGYASQLSDTGHKYVTTYPLDFLKTKPTFVKLHLEGAELAALKGAQRTLVEYRPIIAVTTYHNEDGVWKIPVYLMGLLEKYKFLFRVHSWCGTGAVMYAIPKERYA